MLLVEAASARCSAPGGRRGRALLDRGGQRGGGYGGSYGAAKAAPHAWMYWLARELGPDRITINLVLLGYVPASEFFGDRRNLEAFDEVIARTRSAGAGTAEEVAATVGFPAPRTGYITGSCSESTEERCSDDERECTSRIKAPAAQRRGSRDQAGGSSLHLEVWLQPQVPAQSVRMDAPRVRRGVLDLPSCSALWPRT